MRIFLGDFSKVFLSINCKKIFIFRQFLNDSFKIKDSLERGSFFYCIGKKIQHLL
jgi:hypothetical protein